MAIPSLAMIPSGYKDGKVYSVLPSNGDGDFTFSRGSSATRVNQDGLIEDVRQIGEELITNGDFATDSNWTKQSSWTIGGGIATYDAVVNSHYIQQNLAFISGKEYKFTFTVSGGTGNSRIGFYSDNNLVVAILPYSNGTHTVYGTPSTVGLNLRIFAASSGGAFSIDNVSVKEVLSFDIPRLDYTDGSCPSLLLEGQSSNLITYSEAFDNAAWTTATATVSSNSLISPEGVLNASKLIENTSNGQHRIDFTSSSNIATNTFSVFAKKGERSVLWLRIGGDGAFFNLDNGTASSQSSGITSSSTPFGNGWFRCTITKTSTVSNEICRVNISALTSSYQGDGTSGIYIYGAQLEQQSYATSYIPTNGAVATRLADVCNSAGNASTFNDSEGVLMAEISALTNDSSVREIALSDGGSSNRVELRYGAASNRIQLVLRSGGAVQSSIFNEGNNIILNNKVLVKYKSNDFSLWVNGFEVGTDTSGNTPIGLSELAFDDGNGGSDFYGKTKQIQYFNTALTDIEIEELSSWSSFLEMAEGQQYKIK